MHHILLVDDDLNFRRSLVIQLELEGYRVTEIESTRQAFTFLKKYYSNEKFPELLITDMRMPEMEGEEFVRTLQEEYPDLPVLVISAFELPEALGEYPFLRKPFRIQQMIETINLILNNESNR